MPRLRVSVFSAVFVVTVTISWSLQESTFVDQLGFDKPFALGDALSYWQIVFLSSFGAVEAFSL